MAIWQARFDLIPKECLNVECSTFHDIADLNIDKIKWSIYRSPDLNCLRKIKSEIESWSPEIRFWGSENSDHFAVMYDNDTVEWVSVYIDLRGSYMQFLSEAVWVAKTWNSLFLHKEKICFSPNIENAVGFLHDTLAYKYVRNPEEAFRSIGQTKKRHHEP